MLNVLVTSPERVLFEGMAGSVSVPGEHGTFEILMGHRPLISRMRAGMMVVDRQAFAIRRGAVRVADGTVTVVVELAG